MSTKKSSKRFVLSTDALNSQGFRMLTSGADLSEFNENPILLYNHIRSDSDKKDQILAIGYWDDIMVEDGRITAVPVFDATDEFAMSIYNKVENGTLRMCSAGAEPIETSEDPAHLLPGQTHATVTRWKLKEGSICDIGSNPQALAVQLYQGSAQIQLNETSISKINLMADSKKDEKTAKAADSEKKDEKTAKAADSEKKDEQLNDDEKNEELNDDDREKLLKRLQDLEKENEKLRKQLNDSEEEKKLSRAESLITLSLKEGKISAKQKEHFLKLAQTDFDATKSVLDAMSPHVKLSDRFNAAAATADQDDSREAKIREMSWKDLMRSESDMKYLKANMPETYQLKYRERFGRDPQG